MRRPTGVRRLVQLFLGRRGVERAVNDELRFHLEMRADDLVRAGMSREAATMQARQEFGDVDAARHELSAIDRRYDTLVASAEWWRGVLIDARVALRSYRRQPGFTVVVLLTLALGIGATTAMFTVVNAVLLRPLPYFRPDRLVFLQETHQGNVSNRSEASYPDFVDWRAQTTVFAALEGYDGTNVAISGPSGAEMIQGARITSGFFGMLGVRPSRGTGFTHDDDVSGGTRAVVLSQKFWARRFGADADIVGKSITVDGVPFEIRGVLPASFMFAPAGDVDLWLPLGRNTETRAQRFNHWVRVVGRLRDGVDLRAARERMSTTMRVLAQQYPQSNSGRDVEITPLRDRATANVERPVLVLFGAVAILLLIACANVAGLVVGRSIERGREMAVRSAIGASRARVVRQLLTEHLVLALAGAALGAWVAAQGVRLLVAAIPSSMFDQMPSVRDVSVDITALVFAIGIAIVTGLAFGLAPALLASRLSAAELLRSDTRSGASPTRHWLRDVLVASEIALTLVLLVGATLMGKSLVALLRLNPGFAVERVAGVRVALPRPAYNDNDLQTRFFENAVARVRALPAVEAVGAISNAPLQGGGTNTFKADGEPEPPLASRPEATTRAVAGDYFNALRIPVLEGRALNVHDDLTSFYAVNISEALARRLFGTTQAALGRRLRFYAWQDSGWTIVGVVGDVKTDAMDEPAAPAIYYSHLQGPANRMSIFARSAGVDATALIPPMRRGIQALDLTVPVYSAETMVDRIAKSPAVYSRRYLLVLLGAFAVAALFLAVIGVYGVISYAVTQRTREIAIRMALGARSAEVLSLVLRRGLRLVAGGIVIGATAALALTRTLSSLLFGVSPGDAWTYGAAATLLVLVAVTASYLPARRATRFDPAIALRCE